MLHLVVNCGPAEDYIGKCIDSIRSQTAEGWQAHVTIDPCGDDTYAQALLARGGDRRIQIRRNGTRRYSMFNLIQAVRHSGAAEDDIIVVLDGDDRFATPDALRIIEATHRDDDCWMTYGSWISDSPTMDGMWPAYPEGLENLRRHEWLGTAVRTWKRWLWDRIDDADLRDASGRYYRVTEDQAAMLPMLEMSGLDRAKHIPEALMIYNRTSPHACSLTMRDEMHANERHIRSRAPYQRLTDRRTRLAGNSSARQYGHSAV